jgi:hypothetical protein
MRGAAPVGEVEVAASCGAASIGIDDAVGERVAFLVGGGAEAIGDPGLSNSSSASASKAARAAAA